MTRTLLNILFPSLGKKQPVSVKSKTALFLVDGISSYKQFITRADVYRQISDSHILHPYLLRDADPSARRRQQYCISSDPSRTDDCLGGLQTNRVLQ
jgi:hypothetical protein